jgi:hypothetical protein
MKLTCFIHILDKQKIIAVEQSTASLSKEHGKIVLENTTTMSRARKSICQTKLTADISLDFGKSLSKTTEEVSEDKRRHRDWKDCSNLIDCQSLDFMLLYNIYYSWHYVRSKGINVYSIQVNSSFWRVFSCTCLKARLFSHLLEA